MAQNPYAAPSAAVADVTPQGEYMLAGRGMRLLAAIIDGLLAIPLYVAAVFMVGTMRSEQGGLSAGLVVFMLLYLVALLAVQLTLLYRNGQTVGKKLVSVKIVRKDGSRAPLARIFWLRMVVNGLPGVIPYLGGLYALVDVLFIFGEPRRCVHDYIADTVVIQA